MLAACGGVKKQIGLERTPPDEFAVVKRAPLSLPPDYTLRPPQPGAPRPQEQETAAQAQAAVFGSAAAQVTAPTTAEGALLSQAGAQEIDPGIRQKVDAETASRVDKNKPVVDKILSIGSSEKEVPATVLNAKKEAARLEKNKEEGKPVTEGETPSIED